MSRSICLVIAVLAVLSLVLACAPSSPTAASTKPSAPPAPTAVPAPASIATAAPVVTAAPKAAEATPKPAEATAKPAAKIKRGGTLRYRGEGDFQSMDPHLNIGLTTQFSFLYDALFRIRYDEGTKQLMLEPELVTSFERTDPLTLVLKLRKGVKFHDGSDFNAAVAKWNFDRILTHPKSRKDQTEAIKSVDVVDDYTIKLNLKGPAASDMVNVMLAPGDHCAVCMISKEAMEKQGEDGFARRPSGTGPMRFVEWLNTDHVTMQRWDNYWMMGEDGKPLPYMDGVIIRYIQDSAVAVMELRTGNVDMSGGNNAFLPKDLPIMQADPNLVYAELPWSGGARAFGINPDNGVFGGKAKARQAAMHAIDRESMSKALQPGRGGAYSYLWGQYELGYDPLLPKYTFDAPKAKQLLTEAGYPNGMDITITFINRALDQQMATVMKQMLDQVGFRTTLDGIEKVAVLQRGVAGTLEFTTFNKSFYREADQNSVSFTSEGSLNWIGRKNPAVDKCMDEGRIAPDQKQRADIYKRCQTLLHEEAVYSSMFYYPNQFVYRKEVKGVQLEFDKFNRNFMWLDR